MAEQMGIFPMKGTIGKVTFYRTRDGYRVREKGGLDASRISNDPSFQRTRENMAEFGRAGKAGKVLRSAIRSLIKNVADARMIGRLTRAMMEVIKADAVSPRGQRNVIDGEAELLQGFEFNANSKLGTTLFAPYSYTINRVTGELSIDIASFVPLNMVSAPAGATHFKIISAGVEIDFENETYVSTIQSSNNLPWNETATAAINLVNTVTANSTKPLFLVLGIEFYQEVNGNAYALSNGAFNALCLVAVNGG
jgi:hypothetical protein